MLADICDRLPGADVDVVTKALGADTRIGAKYLKGYGGLRLSARATTWHSRPSPGRSARAPTWLWRPMRSTTTRSTVSAISSPKFAEGRHQRSADHRPAILQATLHTSVVEEMPTSVKLAARLADAGYVVTVHDPLAQDAALVTLGEKVVGASSLESAVRECDLLIVGTGWPEYSGDSHPALGLAAQSEDDHPRPLAHTPRRQVRRRRRCDLSRLRSVERLFACIRGHETQHDLVRVAVTEMRVLPRGIVLMQNHAVRYLDPFSIIPLSPPCSRTDLRLRWIAVAHRNAHAAAIVFGFPGTAARGRRTGNSPVLVELVIVSMASGTVLTKRRHDS